MDANTAAVRDGEKGASMPGTCWSERPCRRTRCEFHAQRVVSKERRARPLEEWPATCQREFPVGPVTLEVVGYYLGVTRERARQLEQTALVKLRSRAQWKGLSREHRFEAAVGDAQIPSFLEERRCGPHRGESSHE